jgi:hypothetical protein
MLKNTISKQAPLKRDCAVSVSQIIDFVDAIRTAIKSIPISQKEDFLTDVLVFVKTLFCIFSSILLSSKCKFAADAKVIVTITPKKDKKPPCNIKFDSKVFLSLKTQGAVKDSIIHTAKAQIIEH